MAALKASTDRIVKVLANQLVSCDPRDRAAITRKIRARLKPDTFVMREDVDGKFYYIEGSSRMPRMKSLAKKVATMRAQGKREVANAKLTATDRAFNRSIDRDIKNIDRQLADIARDPVER